MSEELQNEAQNAELEKIEKIKLSLDKLVNKKSKFYLLYQNHSHQLQVYMKCIFMQVL